MTTNVFRVRHVAGGTLADRARTCSALCLTYLNVAQIAEQSNSRKSHLQRPAWRTGSHRVVRFCEPNEEKKEQLRKNKKHLTSGNKQ